MYRRHFFTVMQAGIIKGEFYDAFTAEFGNRLDADPGIRADRALFGIGDKFDQVGYFRGAFFIFNAGIQVFQIFSDHDQIDIIKAGRYSLIGFARAQADIQLQFFAQRDIDTAEAGSDRGCDRTFDRDFVFSDRFDDGSR